MIRVDNLCVEEFEGYGGVILLYVEEIYLYVW